MFKKEFDYFHHLFKHIATNQQNNHFVGKVSMTAKGFNKFFYMQLLEVEHMAVTGKEVCRAPFHQGGLGPGSPRKMWNLEAQKRNFQCLGHKEELFIIIFIDQWTRSFMNLMF